MSKKAAQRKLDQILESVNEVNGGQADVYTEVRFREVLESYWPSYLDDNSVKESTCDAYKSIAGKWVRPFFQEMVLTDINPRTVGKFMSSLTKQGLSARYRRTDPLKQVLLDQRKQTDHDGPEDFVFCQPDGRPFNPDTLRRFGIYPAIQEAGIPFRPRASGCHAFRHLAGTLVHRKTGSLKLAQKQPGHADVSTTGNIYTHVDDSELRQVADVLGDALGDSCGRRAVDAASGTDAAQ